MRTSINEKTQDVEQWCRTYIGKSNWRINENGEIDVNGDCEVVKFDGARLPYKFGIVTGSFYAWVSPYEPSKMNLESLENCPTEVGKDFVVSGNMNLKSLGGGPSKVGGRYKCNNCALHSLDGLASEIGGGLYAYANPMEDIRELDNCNLSGMVDFQFCKLAKQGTAYRKLMAEGRVAND